jgi:hypothetical protein
VSAASVIALAILIGCGLAAAGRVPVRPPRHRARRLNEALHELRRPLQALALAPARPGNEQWIAQAGRALAELEAAVNGPRPPAAARRGAVGLDELIDAARIRWAGASLEFEVELPRAAVHGDRVAVHGDPVALASALDNLIANALEHGRGPVTVRASNGSGAVRVQVANLPRSPGADRSASADPRHGHGLRRAARIAGDHGGVLLPPRLGRDGVLTELRLPTTGPGAR